jgi:hypothetical protein
MICPLFRFTLPVQPLTVPATPPQTERCFLSTSRLVRRALQNVTPVLTLCDFARIEPKLCMTVAMQ